MQSICARLVLLLATATATPSIVAQRRPMLAALPTTTTAPAENGLDPVGRPPTESPPPLLTIVGLMKGRSSLHTRSLNAAFTKTLGDINKNYGFTFRASHSFATLKDYSPTAVILHNLSIIIDEYSMIIILTLKNNNFSFIASVNIVCLLNCSDKIMW